MRRLQRWAFALCFVAATLSHCASAQTARIIGTVTTSSGQPLTGANVFLAGTRLGAATATDGSFLIDSVPLGSFELVVSFVGFETYSTPIRLVDASKVSLEISLMRTVAVSEALEIVADSPRTRRRHLALFEKYFLGVSRFASDCTISNPEVLSFEMNDRTDVFSASASEPLIIVNRALGYEIRFVLDEFRLHEGRRAIQYGGRPSFTELVPENEREAREWSRNRLRAYNGSRRHFLASLAADRLHEEGFMVLAEQAEPPSARGVPGSRPSKRVRGVPPSEILSAGELPFERRLSFPGFLKVLYFPEPPDGPYLRFREFMDRGMRADEDAQVSWISLNQSSVTFSTDGILGAPMAITRLGYWFFERVAELLPFDYRPEGQTDPRALPGRAGVDRTQFAAAFSEGLAHSEEGDFEAAISRLSDLVLFASDYENGHAAFVLGQAWEEVGRPDSAAITWRRGLQGLAEQGILHAEMADAFVRNTFLRQDRTHYEAATATYFELLEQLDDEPADRGLQRQAAQALLLFTAEERRSKLTRPPGPLNQRFSPIPGLGAELVTWWRAQDPLPGTPLNERLVEHLARTAYSESNYGFRGDLLGFDDRGKAFVQFGAPGNAASIVVDVARSAQVLRENGYALPGPLIPPMNELWTYRHVDDLVYHLFVLEGGRYQEATPEDLVPPVLQSGYKRVGQGYGNVQDASNRGGDQVPANQALAEALVETWRSVYTSLAAQHPAFEAQLSELDMHDSDVRATQLGGASLAASALSYVNAAQAQFRALASQAIKRREEEAPQTWSRVETTVNRIPVDVRYARFLEDDGSTRTELYWTHEEGTLQLGRRLRRQVLGDAPDPDRYLLEMAVALYSEDYAASERKYVSYLAADLDSLALGASQTLDVTGGRTPFSLALQWDQFLYNELPDGSFRKGEYLKTGVRKLDDLRPLNADPAVLEISDLKPVLIPESGLSEEEDLPVYPSASLREGAALGIQFEIYHLTYGQDDKTSYTVEYELVSNPNGRAETTTSASVGSSGSSPKAVEVIALDLGTIGIGREVEIRVRVIDDVTGRRAERTINFEKY